MLLTKRFSVVFTALIAIAALAALAIHSTAKGAKPGGGGTTATFTLTDLKGFTTYAWASGLNNPTAGTVQIVGTSHPASGQGQYAKAALWEVTSTGSVSLTDLGNPGNFSSNAIAVNDDGLILMTGPGFSVVDHPVIGWRFLPDERGAYALNNLGDVACLDRIWNVDPLSGNVTKLSEFGGYETFYARDINDLRVMAGSQQDIPAIAWFDPTPNLDGTLQVQVQKLGLLPGTAYGRANAINIWGAVVGECGDCLGTHPFLWTEATGMIALGDFGGPSGRALDINDMGQVVGWSYSASGGDSSRAFLWEKGKMSDLNVLSGAGSKRTLSDASAINNFGQIVGSMKISGPGNERHAFLLTPKP